MQKESAPLQIKISLIPIRALELIILTTMRSKELSIIVRSGATKSRCILIYTVKVKSKIIMEIRATYSTIRTIGVKPFRSRSRVLSNNFKMAQEAFQLQIR